MDRRSWKARPVNTPQPGWFKMRLVRGGPFVPARIQHRNGLWWAEIDGQTYEANFDPSYAPEVFRIWHAAEEITETEYQVEIRGRRAPDAPRSNQPIDLANLPPLF